MVVFLQDNTENIYFSNETMNHVFFFFGNFIKKEIIMIFLYIEKLSVNNILK